LQIADNAVEQFEYSQGAVRIVTRGTSASARLRSRSVRNFFLVIDLALAIYLWLLLAVAVTSWLIGFNVIGSGNRTVAVISKVLDKVTGPALRPIRSLLPDRGVDISPVILILIVVFVRYVIALYVLPNS
jgi:YggT family protein